MPTSPISFETERWIRATWYGKSDRMMKRSTGVSRVFELREIATLLRNSASDFFSNQGMVSNICTYHTMLVNSDIPVAVLLFSINFVGGFFFHGIISIAVQISHSGSFLAYTIGKSL